jgi:hypothetical protein
VNVTQLLASDSEPAREHSGTFFHAAEITAAARERRVRLLINGFTALLLAGAVGLGVGLAIITA